MTHLSRPELLRAACLAGGFAVVGLPGFVALRSYLREVRELFPERRPVRVPLESAGLAGASPVSFRDAGGRMLRGWVVPSRNGAGIVLAHGAGGDRASLLPEARFLSARGFGLLLFDWPGHGESEGDVEWGGGEARALVAAVDFLSSRPGVEASRLGAFAFSMGGVVLARVAAAEPRIGAVVLVSTPSDQDRQVRWENRRYGPLGEIPALFAVRRRAPSLFDDKPKDSVGAISPRPLLVVSGAEDQVVPPFLAEELFAAAREPKEHLEVPHATHGGFVAASPSIYPERVSAFFERALLGEHRGRALP